MPAVTRKRKEAPAVSTLPAKKQSGPKKGAVAKAVDAVKEKVAEVTPQQVVASRSAGNTRASSPADRPEVGHTIDIKDFGGDFETQDGIKVTLQELVDKSKAGVVLFTYPKASTPGCTKQACLFRDGYDTLTAGGLSIYGLSGDSPKSNTTFKMKQKLPYDLLCNPSYSLIGAIGMQDKPAKKTKRGVFAIDKSGRVIVATRGGPQATVDAVKEVVDKMAKGEDGDVKSEEEMADTAGEITDTS